MPVGRPIRVTALARWKPPTNSVHGSGCRAARPRPAIGSAASGAHSRTRYPPPRLQPLRPDPCPPKTRADLEWDRVLSALADRCAGPLGRDLALGLGFAESRDEARDVARAGGRGDDAPAARAGPLPVSDVDDVRDAIERARVGGVLAPAELRALERMLGAARALRRFLASRKAALPRLFEACATDPTLDDVADEISGCFEVDGTLADRASPRLRELRGEWHAARQRMLSRMEDLMSRYESVVQDRFVTEREGRWVLPVRSDAHERFPGIVHATSSSGATLFVEPRAVVPMGNRLKVLDAEVKREEEAVYARLTALLGDALPSVEAACRRARPRRRARARRRSSPASSQLVFPDVVDEPRLDLKRARHPLLALEMADRVVPSDLAIEAGRGIVVSGPNAGGKTVALKTMGLAALMVRAGMPVACAEGSTVGLLDVVLTDVGDDQSLHKNLSTFSAHVKNLVEVLQETGRGALVLLDELAGGTDPREGEALAAGVLDSLCARGGAVAATTHYEGLKALALVDERFVNASVGRRPRDDDAHLRARDGRPRQLERARGGAPLRDAGDGHRARRALSHARGPELRGGRAEAPRRARGAGARPGGGGAARGRGEGRARAGRRRARSRQEPREEDALARRRPS